MKDFLIIGQGAAGSFLALELLKQNKSILIVDDDHKKSSSYISAGIINPITGKRFALTDGFDEFYNYAVKQYNQLEEQFDEKFFNPIDILRVYQNESERDHWQRKMELNIGAQYTKQINAPEKFKDLINDPLGSVVIQRSGFCHTRRLLKVLKGYFKETETILNQKIEYKDLDISDDYISYQHQRFKNVVFCEGYQSQWNPWFDWVPFNSVKGEILKIEIEASKLPNMIINKGKWCAPIGENLWMSGSSYIWDQLDCKPSKEARDQIIEGLSQCITNQVKVVDHKAGVRPVIKDQKVVMGRHPKYPNLCIFNGLGSKGFLMAPLCAFELVGHLCKGSALREDFALDRFKMELE